MPFKLIIEPTTTPVSLSEAKVQCKVEADDTSEDAFILDCIQAAVDTVQSEKDCQLMTATWDMYLDCWRAMITIKKQPVQSITAIYYIDKDGNEVELDSSLYSVDTVSAFARLQFFTTMNYPSLQDNRLNAIRIRFVAGYANSDSVPFRIKRFILACVREFYDKRDASFKMTKHTEGLLTNLSYEV